MTAIRIKVLISLIICMLATLLVVYHHAPDDWPQYAAGRILRRNATEVPDDDDGRRESSALSADYPHKIAHSGREHKNTNIVAIYAGRWKFLRVQLPYLHRDLRVNGGLIDEVWFMIVKCRDDDMKRLINFIETANSVLKKKVFSIHLKSPDLGEMHSFIWPYFEILPKMISDPNMNFFKFDDDIVYIHPEAFSNILAQNDPNCLMYFFNIAGSHWRLNWIYQTQFGLYKDPYLNPKNLSFEYNYQAQCGWISPDCNEMGLKTFLYHYNNNSLDKLLFNRLEHLVDKNQFSFNAVLFKHDVIDLTAMIQSKPIWKQDERYWTVEYTNNSKRHNCIVGNALVVHFSYQKTIKYMLEKTNLLQHFHDLIRKNRKQFKMDYKLWKILKIYD